MVDITYFAHSTTTDNQGHLATGWLPGELSEDGREQAKKLGKQVAEQHFDIVFCSDLQRAIDSANLSFGDKYRVIQDKRLRECNYGDLNGKPSTFKDAMESYIDIPFPSGESYRDVEKRMTDFLEFLKQNYDGKHVAIVAHQAPQLALDVLLNGRTWPQAINEDWRRNKTWRTGWKYSVD